MDDKRWIELAKRKKQDKYFGFISLLIVVMMVFFTVKNIGWLLTFIVVAVILYFWIDVEQILEDSDAISSRTVKIVFIVLGTMYELVSIIFAFVNLDYLLVAFGIISAGYLGFKTNAVLRKDLKNKNLKFADSMIATFLGIVVASLIVAFTPRDILWLFLLIFALAYNLLHLIVRIKVEHDWTNRQL